MVCNDCGGSLGEYVPSANIKSVTCWKCVAKMVAPPTQPQVKLTEEEKLAHREARKKETRERRASEKQQKETSRAMRKQKSEEYKQKAVARKAERQKKYEEMLLGSTGEKKKPRGWHLKKHFEFEGQIYRFGKIVSN